MSSKLYTNVWLTLTKELERRGSGNSDFHPVYHFDTSSKSGFPFNHTLNAFSHLGKKCFSSKDTRLGNGIKF